MPRVSKSLTFVFLMHHLMYFQYYDHSKHIYIDPAMLVHRLRRCPNIETTFDKYFVFVKIR